MSETPVIAEMFSRTRRGVWMVTAGLRQRWVCTESW